MNCGIGRDTTGSSELRASRSRDLPCQDTLLPPLISVP